MTVSSKTELIKSTEHELVKQYQELDIIGRPKFLFTAPTDAVNGAPCLVTEFLYMDDTSTQVRGKTEGYDVWDTSWIPDSSFSINNSLVPTKTELIKVNENELSKEYTELDGQNRILRVYRAPVAAETGDPCIVTEYIYQNPTSNIFLGRKEGYTQWDESWIPDSSFTVGF